METLNLEETAVALILEHSVIWKTGTAPSDSFLSQVFFQLFNVVCFPTLFFFKEFKGYLCIEIRDEFFFLSFAPRADTYLSENYFILVPETYFFSTCSFNAPISLFSLGKR